MSSLKNYVEEVQARTQGLSDMERLRYVYLDLGRRFQFDLDFAFGNSKTKADIYGRSRMPSKLDECMGENTAICKSLAYIFEYVTRKLGLEMRTVIDEDDARKLKHMFNVLTTPDGKEYKFDLQEDMRYIKARLRTKHFGRARKKGEPSLIARAELEEIDKKLGYVAEDKYYTNEYLELLKMGMNLFGKLDEKLKFFFENFDEYTDPQMEYADRKWRLEDLIGNDNQDGLLFSRDEKSYIKMIDCYRMIEGHKEYELCVTVQVKDKIDVYLFSKAQNRFTKMTLEEFAELVENGLVNMDAVPMLKKVLRERKKAKEDIDRR